MHAEGGVPVPEKLQALKEINYPTCFVVELT